MDTQSKSNHHVPCLLCQEEEDTELFIL